MVCSRGREASASAGGGLRLQGEVGQDLVPLCSAFLAFAHLMPCCCDGCLLLGLLLHCGSLNAAGLSWAAPIRVKIGLVLVDTAGIKSDVVY